MTRRLLMALLLSCCGLTVQAQSVYDVNHDGKVDAADIVYIIAFIKNGTKLPGFDDNGADADGSGKVDENDLIPIKNIIMTP